VSLHRVVLATVTVAGAETHPPASILVLRALGLGDLLTAVPALRAVAAHFPAHRRVLAAPAGLAPLLELIGGGYEAADVRFLSALGPWYERGGRPVFDVAVNLHGSGPDSHRALLATGAHRLLAFHHPAVHETRGAPEWDPGEHEVTRWCRMLWEHGITADPTDLALRRPPAWPWPGTGEATLIHPGAKSAARRWPVERWAAIAAHERRRGRTVLISGDANERQLAEEVRMRASLPADSVLAGRTDVRGLASLVASVGLVLCGDTGVAHLATALGTPSVLLFGPTSPLTWGPPPGSRRHRVIWAGRLGDPHASHPDPGLLEIGVRDVAEAIDALGRQHAGGRMPVA
jgi:ADP-heptose:LPS heptosyltransferase